MKRWDFNTLSDFVRACDSLSAETKRRHSRSDWTGESWHESIGRAGNGGTDDTVPAAESMLARIQANLPEPMARRWELAHAGAFPCVPAFLSGEPESMWSTAEAPTESNPVRIFVCSTSSGGVSHDDLLKRGCACLGLVLLASRTRPVELFSYAHCSETDSRRGDAVIVQRLQSHPMMLSEVSYVLTSAGWARNLTYAYLSERLGYRNLHWAEAQRRDSYQGGPATRALLGLAESDVLIGPVHAHDPVVKDPIGFVNRELSKLGLTQE